MANTYIYVHYELITSRFLNQPVPLTAVRQNECTPLCSTLGFGIVGEKRMAPAHPLLLRNAFMFIYITVKLLNQYPALTNLVCESVVLTFQGTTHTPKFGLISIVPDCVLTQTENRASQTHKCL